MAVKVSPQFYWVAALSNYVFSFLAGFSIGQFTVAITFIFLTLAVGYSLGRIQSKVQYSIYTGTGILFGIIMVTFVDDYWVFYPFWTLLPDSVFS